MARLLVTCLLSALGTAAATNPGKVEQVQLLGTDQKLDWKQDPEGLRVSLPSDYRPRADYAAALKIILAR